MAGIIPVDSEECFLKTMKTSLEWTPLHCMVEKEEITSIKELLTQTSDVNASDYYNRTSLSIAGARGNARIIELLLEAGAQIDEGFPLHFACENGDVEAVSCLIKRGADVNLRKDKTCPLIVAAAKGHLEISKVLIENGADVLAVDKNKETALHWACESGNEELISYLIDAGCDVDAWDEYQLTPLLVCLIRMSDRSELVRLLLSKGASVKLLDIQNYSVLHNTENPESTLELIKAGADVNVQTINKETPLFRATFYDQLDDGKVLLEYGADPNISAEGGWTPLHCAAEEGWIEYVEELIRCGADVNARSARNIISLHFAAQEGHLEVVNKLLKNGSLVDVPALDIPDVNAISIYFSKQHIPEGATPLSLAADKGHFEVCKLLVSYGASCKNENLVKEITDVEVAYKNDNDWPCNEIIAAVQANNMEKVIRSERIDVIDVMGWTLLHHSVLQGLYQMSYELIKKGVSVNALDKYDRTPLSIAAGRNDLKLLELLLDNGADADLGLALHYTSIKNSTDCIQELVNRKCDVNIKNKKAMLRNTALIEAASDCNCDIVKLLLENNVDPNIVNEWKETALHQSCRFGDIESVRALIKHGADVNSADKSSATPLILCDDPDILSFLLENKANVNVKDDQGWTPLHHAACRNSERDVFELINAGVSINALTDEGETALFLTDNITILKTLIQHGADINVCSFKGWTALHESANSGNVECVKELLKHGANVNKGSLENILPIYLAAVRGHVEVAEELLKHGSFVDPRILDLTITSIREASLWSRYHIVLGNTPLIAAVSKGHLKIVKVLHTNGASLDAANYDGNTALHEAVLNNVEEVVQYLTEQNVDFNVKNKHEKTALDLARVAGNETIINFFIAK